MDYIEPQYTLSRAEATIKDLNEATIKDLGELTIKEINEKYGKVISNKIDKPTFTEPNKGTVAYTEPPKGE
ncbi:hypothetical protein ES708_17632 [subsurface metagenome]